VADRRVCVGCSDHVFALQSRAEAQTISVDLVCDVTLAHGTKILTIHSTIALQNHTSNPLQLRVVDETTVDRRDRKVKETKEEEISVREVKAGEKMWMPVLAGANLQRDHIRSGRITLIALVNININSYDNPDSPDSPDSPDNSI